MIRLMRPLWSQGILARSGLALLGLLLLFAVATVAINVQVNRDRAEQATQRHLNQLLDTVESTASIACFAKDEVLAAELVSGLLRNSEVLSATVEADGAVLATMSRAQTGAGTKDEETPAALVRDIYSPFSPQMPVGRVLLTPNQQLIDEMLRHETRRAMVQMALQVLLVGLSFAAAILILVIRPIKGISDKLHHMDATRGERLQVPGGHQGSEIGQLVVDVNQLAVHLVEALDDERALRIQHEIDQQRYQAIFENAQTGLFILGEQGRLESWNPAFARLMGFDPDAKLIAVRSLVECNWIEPARLAELLVGCVQTGSSRSAVLRYRPSDHSDCWLNLVLTPISDQSIQGVVHDVTQHLEAERSAKQLAITDQLTGVANKLGLEQRVEELASVCNGGQSSGFAFVLISLDNFKRTTEGLDPAASDALLIEVTQRLSNCVKGSDVVARFGEYQFAVLLVDLNAVLVVERITERILAALGQHFSVAGCTLKFQIHAGIALYPHDTGADVSTLLRHADLALSNAKSSTESRMRFFSSDLARLAEGRHRLEADLHRAISADQFVLFFQPIVDLRRGSVVGAEALIRWQHPERGLVPPDQFIPLAEDTGFICELGLWVLESAGQQLAAWGREGRDLYLSVNVSAQQIPKAPTVAVLLDLSRRLGFEPSSLALEITEGVLIDDVGAAQSWLEEAHAAGFRIYLDDFGTGYSSLSYLKRFSFDRLKIDRSFVRDIGANHSDQSLISAVTAMASSFAMEVIAEGVEDPSQIALLRSMGCHFAQGYFFSRPVPIEAFLEASERIPRLFDSIRIPQS